MPLASRTGEVKYRIKGDPGADAFSLVTSVSQVYQNMSGSFNPSSFRVYAYKGTAPAVGMYIQVWGSADNQSWTYISYKLITYSNYYIDITVKSAYKYYIIRLYDHNPSTDIDVEPNFYASASVSVIKDGEPGAQGNPGAKMRMRTWTSGTYYMRGVGEEEWYDVVEYEGRLYLCRVSHTASSSNSPISGTGYWEIAQNWTFIATQLLLAGKIVSDKITADLIDADGIKAENVDISGTITADRVYTPFSFKASMPIIFDPEQYTNNIIVWGNILNTNGNWIVLPSPDKIPDGCHLRFYSLRNNTVTDKNVYLSVGPDYRFRWNGENKYSWYKLPPEVMTEVIAVNVESYKFWMVCNPIAENFFVDFPE